VVLGTSQILEDLGTIAGLQATKKKRVCNEDNQGILLPLWDTYFPFKHLACEIQEGTAQVKGR
jgi:hypothetical protein